MSPHSPIDEEHVLAVIAPLNHVMRHVRDDYACKSWHNGMVSHALRGVQ